MFILIYFCFFSFTFEHLLFLEKHQYIYIQYMTLTNHSTFCRSYEIKFLLLLRYFKNKINYVFSTRQRWYRAQRPTLTSAWSSPTREGVTYPWTTSWSPSTPRYCPLSFVQEGGSIWKTSWSPSIPRYCPLSSRGARFGQQDCPVETVDLDNKLVSFNIVSIVNVQ